MATTHKTGGYPKLSTYKNKRIEPIFTWILNNNKNNFENEKDFIYWCDGICRVKCWWYMHGKHVD